MKQTQNVFFTGYVTINVEGYHPELFFDLCTRNGIVIWNIKKTGEMVCRGNIKLKDISKIREIRRGTVYKISFVQKKGLPFISKNFFVKRGLVTGIIVSMLFVFLLSNIVWDVKINGVHPEIEKRIEEQLRQYGIYPGAVKFSVGSPGVIQQNLLSDIPELLWVGVTEKGTTYYLEGVEKTVVEEKEKNGPRNIIAAKAGVIIDMFVSKGQPMVKVNDFVKKGDLLVSGELGEKLVNDEEDEEKQHQAKELITAEAEIIARTWYESEVNVPLEVNYNVLTGENKEKHYLRFWNFLLPIWGFKNPDYEEVQIDAEQSSFNFFKSKFPISYVKQNIQEKRIISQKRTHSEAIADGIEQAKKNLQNNLGENADITFEKVLHESMEHGKVKLIIYFNVNENIAKNQPISQGD
ncbi:sporulation protein YqfD [Aquibacillus halophilus]|uniref:Sporulation protein YqfD n=1 Tax=Aquibacillus halophilus TaxID=930132 RepID=A0A6A8DEY5_9BACI|nr:sporulation protein YqfD [Aquibacillus halophilus]MRH43086.1 sporulation protein YqfD [Aquibacillus halophilus]